MNAKDYRLQRDKAFQAISELNLEIAYLRGRIAHLTEESDTYRRQWIATNDRLTEIQRDGGGK